MAHRCGIHDVFFTYPSSSWQMMTSLMTRVFRDRLRAASVISASRIYCILYWWSKSGLKIFQQPCSRYEHINNILRREFMAWLTIQWSFEPLTQQKREAYVKQLRACITTTCMLRSPTCLEITSSLSSLMQPNVAFVETDCIYIGFVFGRLSGR